jgi:ubiquinone/menaquinone biosynthesis C-methylase UbiE
MSDGGKEATLITQQKYDRNSRLYNLVEFPMELLWYRRWRRQLFNKIKEGRVLEVGIGTGKNLRYYRQRFWAVGVDLSAGMLAKAKPLATAKDVSLAQMDVENLAFPDDTFDTILATFVFCSVPDPIRGLREIRRTLRPDGQMLLIEHVLPKNPVLARVFDVLDSLTATLTGVHINRKTSDNIRRAGFELIQERNLLLTIFRLLVAKPPGKENEAR